MVSDYRKYNEIFDYLRTPDRPFEAHGNFVFGRKDQRLVKKMGELCATNLAKYFLVAGGVGKDSGDLTKLGVPEAHYLGLHALEAGIPVDKLYLETTSTNGGENARNGMKIITEQNLPHDKLTVIAHATSLRRLAETLVHESTKANSGVRSVYRVPTDYPFDASSPVDQDEARRELLRLADWPDKGLLGTQSHLPIDLVDFARDSQDNRQQ